MHRSNNQECKELQDRLYRCKESPQCIVALGTTPEFPYKFINVSPAPAPSVIRGASQVKKTNHGNRYSSVNKTNTSYRQNNSTDNTIEQQSYGQNANNRYSSSAQNSQKGYSVSTQSQRLHTQDDTNQVRFVQDINKLLTFNTTTNKISP